MTIKSLSNFWICYSPFFQFSAMAFKGPAIKLKALKSSMSGGRCQGVLSSSVAKPIPGFKQLNVKEILGPLQSRAEIFASLFQHRVHLFLPQLSE